MPNKHAQRRNVILGIACIELLLAAMIMAPALGESVTNAHQEIPATVKVVTPIEESTTGQGQITNNAVEEMSTTVKEIVPVEEHPASEHGHIATNIVVRREGQKLIVTTGETDSTYETTPIETNPASERIINPIEQNPISDESKVSPVIEKTYDTEDGMFRIHYVGADEQYAKFVGHAFSKAREFQLALGFNDITLPRTINGETTKVPIYVKDLIYDDKASDSVIGNGRLDHFLVSDNLDESKIYLAAANEYFNAVRTSYNTMGYEASVDKAWINDGVAKFITLYTAMNDPEYKQYDEEYAQYGYLNNVMVEGKKIQGYAAYQVPTVTSDSPLNNGVSKLGALSVSYWYYLHSIYGMQVIEDVISKSGSFNDDSIRTVSSVLTNYNATFADTVTGWYKSLGFWNKEKIGDFSVYEGLMLVNDEMFEQHKTNELPLKIENQLSRYGVSFVNLKFNSNVPMAKIKFLNSGEALEVHAYIYNAMIDKYYQESFTVERGYHEFTIWGANAEINFIVIGSEDSVNGGFTISGGL